jgi:transcriptional regulator with XRE-family HTH domain
MPKKKKSQGKTPTTLAERMVIARERMGISQAAVARRVDTSPQAIQQLESGNNQSSRRLVDIAVALHVRPEWLQHGIGDMTGGGSGGHDDLMLIDVLVGVLTALKDLDLDPPPERVAEIFVYMLKRLEDVSPEVWRAKAEEWSKEVVSFSQFTETRKAIR